MKYSKPFAAVLFASLAFVACAKKDSDFAARYAKNKMGAEAVDAQTTGEADVFALENGVDVDVLSINQTVNGSEKVMTSVVVLNDQQVSLTTRHTGNELRSGKLVQGNVTVVANAVCALAVCNPYYISVEVYKDNKLLIQEGIRKYFGPAGKEVVDRYTKLKAENSKPLISGSSYSSKDLSDDNTMVGYLNSTADSNGYVK